MKSIICGLCKPDSENTNEPDFETRCMHHFHKDCLKKRILYGNNKCPECGKAISVSETLESILGGWQFLTEDEKRFISILSLNQSDLRLLNSLSTHLENMDRVYGLKEEIINILLEIASDAQLKDSDEAIPIWYACSLGQNDVLDFLQKNTRLNREDYFFVSAVFRNGHLNIAKVLLEIDLKADIHNRHGLLKLACKGGHLDVVKLLIKFGADLNIDSWETPLMIASYNGNIEMMNLLFKSGAKINNVRDKKSHSLYIACRNGQIEAIEFLISNGATCLHEFGHDFIKVFCSHKENEKIFGRIFETGIKADINVLRYICEHGTENMIQKTVEAGADINGQDLSGNSVLHYACGRLDVATVEILISLGASVNIKNNDLETPLFELCKGFDYKERSTTRFISILNRLLNSGANINAKDQNGKTVLLVIICKYRINLFEILVEKGADVNAVSNDGNTLIHEACKIGNSNLLKRLLELKCIHINSKNNKNLTPVHQLCEWYDGKSSDLKCLNVLIENGADINSESSSGSTALEFCIKPKHKDFYLTLIEAGAKK